MSNIDILNILLVQPNIFFGDKNKNFLQISQLIEKSFNNNDLIILPETFNTGFTPDLVKYSEITEGPSYSFMKEIAKQFNTSIMGSIIVNDNGKHYNRLLIVTADGSYKYYNKRHTFTYAGEHNQIEKGNKHLISEIREFKIMPLICYDLRFPVWSRNTFNYDLLVYVANWPKSRIEAWNVLLRARAIENQCFVVGVNTIGTSLEGIEYGGNSQIINPLGVVVNNLGNSIEALSININKKELSDFRQKFPVLNDKDSFTINF